MVQEKMIEVFSAFKTGPSVGEGYGDEYIVSTGTLVQKQGTSKSLSCVTTDVPVGVYNLKRTVIMDTVIDADTISVLHAPKGKAAVKVSLGIRELIDEAERSLLFVDSSSAMNGMIFGFGVNGFAICATNREVLYLNEFRRDGKKLSITSENMAVIPMSSSDIRVLRMLMSMSTEAEVVVRKTARCVQIIYDQWVMSFHGVFVGKELEQPFTAARVERKYTKYQITGNTQILKWLDQFYNKGTNDISMVLHPEKACLGRGTCADVRVSKCADGVVLKSVPLPAMMIAGNMKTQLYGDQSGADDTSIVGVDFAYWSRVTRKLGDSFYLYVCKRQKNEKLIFVSHLSENWF